MVSVLPQEGPHDKSIGVPFWYLWYILFWRIPIHENAQMQTLRVARLQESRTCIWKPSFPFENTDWLVLLEFGNQFYTGYAPRK